MSSQARVAYARSIFHIIGLFCVEYMVTAATDINSVINDLPNKMSMGTSEARYEVSIEHAGNRRVGM